MDTSSPPYQNLTPDRILNAVESLGLRCDGRLLALNSYENRVYQVGIEESAPVIAKFYRPLRWTDEAILEEHRYTLELAARELPVVAPLIDQTGRTLHEFEGFRFTISPRQPGRAPELDDPDTLEWMGRFIGRIHAVGAIEPFAHRPTITIETFGVEPYRYIIANGFIPPDLEAAYISTVEDALQRVRAAFARAAPISLIRLHGDCHPGNVLWSDAGPHFVDFDDCRMGPAMQDIWMLLSGDRAVDDPTTFRFHGRLPGIPRLQPARTAAGRGATHPAPDPLFRLAGPALERPGLSRQLSLVQHPALLAGPDSRIARTGRADGRTAAGSGLESTWLTRKNDGYRTHPL